MNWRIPQAPGPTWLWVVISAALLLILGYVRLGVYPEDLVPLSYGLPLLLFLWRRDLRLLWGTTAGFVTILVSKASIVLAADPSRTATASFFLGMTLISIIVPAVAVHLVIVVSRRLDVATNELLSSNANLETINEELAAREEEISQQNEELQSQATEMEHQAAELRSQAEELQYVNDQLHARERTLDEMVALTAAGANEKEILANFGELLNHLLAPRASGAAIILAAGDDAVTVQALFGLSAFRTEVARSSVMGAVAAEAGRAAYLSDLALRPDIQAPRLANGAFPKSVIAASAGVDDNEWMVLEVYSEEPGAWTEGDLRLTQWCADQCGRLWTIARLRENLARLADSERAARIEAERAVREKEEFVATLAHELRTPIGATLGWANMLRTMLGDPGELEQGLEVIERNSRHQARLISDLLDLSRAARGTLEIGLQPVRVSTVVDAAIEIVRPAAQAKEIRLERTDDPRADAVVTGDDDRLQQVIWNLLTNAVKFTPQNGAVEVKLTREPPNARITITDTGQGIDAELLPHVFDRYRQGDSSPSRTQGGLGLGLAIAKHLVDLHGGTIELRSDGRDRGTTSSVTLPLLPRPDRIDPERSSTSRWMDRETAQRALQGISVLVVDDDPDILEFIGRLLTRCGAIVRTAPTATAALAEIETEKPRLLISDIGMSGMDGFEFIRQIRNHRSDSVRELPAIAMTAFTRAEDRSRALLSGFQTLLAKPVDPANLIAVMVRILEPESPTIPGSP